MSTSFEIVLRRPTAVASTAAAGPSGLDFDSIVMDLCQVLAGSDCFFRIGGFGQSDWPVDVRYDLSTLIEQLPDTLDKVRSRLTAEIDLCAQGVERTLRFEINGDLVVVSCESRTSWTPEFNVENIDYSDLLSMLESVATEFAESLRLVWPQLAGSVPFVNWL
jgi:hypothetical protein